MHANDNNDVLPNIAVIIIPKEINSKYRTEWSEFKRKKYEQPNHHGENCRLSENVFGYMGSGKSTTLSQRTLHDLILSVQKSY